MKMTDYRSLVTMHEWGRLAGAANPAAFVGGPHVRPEHASIRLVEEGHERIPAERFLAGGIQ
ncbi:hypothetical protein SAMN06295879_2348 [Agreia bicolorata]|uniref:Uncharacterized protein n=2 Tax=Agreia bicolorata TaxID=110935 RepID=A0A1T4Y6T5_9MICO|nr:hypothetical protein SAMN06295879_2348 [Agreia bicolorata]